MPNLDASRRPLTAAERRVIQANVVPSRLDHLEVRECRLDQLEQGLRVR